MVRALGVTAAPSVEMAGGLSPLFNTMSIAIDVAPLLVLSFTFEWKSVTQYFTLRAFLLGAVMNLMLIAEHLLVLHDHQGDVLVVTVVGFCLDTAYAFGFLIHALVTDKKHSSRYWMLAILLAFVGVCGALFWGIFHNVQADSVAIAVLTFAAVVGLNASTTYDIITCKEFPDETTEVYTWAMCLLNTVDASYFFVYAYSLSSWSTLTVVSLINVMFGLLQVAVLSGIKVLKLARAAYRRLSAGAAWLCATCRGAFWFVRFMHTTFGRHRNE